MNIQEKAIEYIPHQEPMVFIDDLVEISEQSAVANLNIRPALLFCEAEGFTYMVEYRTDGTNH